MTLLDQVFDIVVCLLLLVLAWRTLSATHLYQSAIFFIAFGLTMALAWVRLAAPDVALAEAAIGAGLLGVLLVDSLRVFARPPETGRDSEPNKPESRDNDVTTSRRRPQFNSAVASVTAGAGCLFLAYVLVAAIHDLPDGGGLTAQAAENLSRSGVEHPVTAVLLNFRGFDTWLEVGVLFLAMLGIFCAGGLVGFSETENPDPPGPLLSWLIRGLAPVMILTAAYLLWLGKLAPGGAFQAGILLAAVGILLRLAGIPLMDRVPRTVIKLGLTFGFGTFLVFGIIALLADKAFLEYPSEWAGEVILLVEAAAAISIGFTAFAFFAYLNSRDQSTGNGDTAGQPRETNPSQ